jgi:glucuronosyltransferase
MKCLQDLQIYLNSSRNGVIYVSYGTSIDLATFCPDKIKILLSAFSKLPYDVLLKWDHDVLPGVSNNVKLSKWLPQADLLSK